MTVLVAVALAACHQGPFPKATIRVGDERVKVEVAATDELRARGLMHRESLPENRGMLFIYRDETPRSFWMKNVSFPLDIGFADREGKLVKITHMHPLDKSSTHSLYPAMYALEMNEGWFERHGVETGDLMTDLPEIEVE